MVDQGKEAVNSNFASVQRKLLSETKKTIIGECPRKDGTLGAGLEALLRARDKILAEHLEKTCKTLSGCADDPFQVFVFSHTHLAVTPYTPIKRGGWRPLVVNTGAWQRTITPQQLAVVSDGLKDEEVLQYIQPEDLPKCYSVVLIGPLKRQDQKETNPRLRYWTVKDDQWSLQEKCNDSDLSEVAREVKKRRDTALRHKNR